MNEIARTKRFLSNIFSSEYVDYHTVTYIFCLDSYLLEINKEFLNHDYLTDVITFNFFENKYADSEIYISVERVKENSKKYEVAYSHEIRRVMIHAALHLCGYKDYTNAQKKEMTKKENFYLLNFESFT